MSGLASAAIIGGATLAGTVGSSLIARGGQNSAGGINTEAGNEAQAAQAAQMLRNATGASPYTATGIASTGLLGSLLGYGTLKSPNPGDMYNYYPDPNAQSNALAQLRTFASGSGATLPTYTPQTFNPVNAVSSTFQADPSYAWRLGQGTAALDSSANANGMGKSGAQLQALDAYGQGAASQEYQNWFARYMNQNAYNTQGQAGVNAANFGQQQAIYGDTQGQWNNALALLTGQSGQGASAATGVNGANTSLTANGNNVGAGTASAAGSNYAAGANALSAGVTGGVNSLASLGAYYGLGGGSIGGTGADGLPASGLPGTGAAASNALAQYGAAPAVY